MKKKILKELLSGIEDLKDALCEVVENKSQTKPILSNQELSDLLSVSKQTLQNYRDTGKIAFSKVGGTIFYKYEDVMKFLEDHRQPTFHNPSK